jgi:hypothetical protein
LQSKLGDQATALTESERALMQEWLSKLADAPALCPPVRRAFEIERFGLVAGQWRRVRASITSWDGKRVSGTRISRPSAGLRTRGGG